MIYDLKLVDRIREYLVKFSKLNVEEKEMFRGLTFMVNDKMCISVSGENMMCRFDPFCMRKLPKKVAFNR